MQNKNLRKLLEKAKAGEDAAIKELLELFKPLIYQNSFINGSFDEDCFQELNLELLKCINSFEFSPNQSIYKHFQETLVKKQS